MALPTCKAIFCLLILPFILAELNICSFNGENLSNKKVAEVNTMKVFVKIASQFDIFAMQEISNGVAVKFLDILNREANDEFLLTFSPALGRTSQTEQYGIYYKKSQVKLVTSWTFMNEDPDAALELFERPPFIATFTSKATSLKRFTLVSMHTKPALKKSTDRVNKEELLNLATVVASIEHEPKIMILGDLNAGCGYLKEGERVEVSAALNATGVNYVWLNDAFTNLALTCPYDRFIATEKFAAAVNRESVQTYRYDEEPEIKRFLLATKLPLANVSDHYPIRMKLN